MAMVKFIFKSETFFLDYFDQRDLISSQWGCSYMCWFIYRSITLLYLLVLLIVGFTNKFMRYQWKFFTMVTHWSFLIFVLNYLLKWICLVKYKRWFREGLKFRDTQDEKRPLLLKQQSWVTNCKNKSHYLIAFSWLTANIAHVLAIYTINYWPDGGVLSISNLPGALNFQMHGINAAMAVVDILLVAQPTFLSHIYQPLLFFASYYSFTTFYYVAGGTSKNGTRYIYPYINWDKPVEALISFGARSFQILIIHIAVWFVASLRIIIARSYTKKQSF